jgi:hypothetical protein
MSNNNTGNTFVGCSSILTGNNNTAFGYSARFNTTGSYNMAFGYSATQPIEPLTAWYKAAVNARGLTPHIPTKDGNSKT